MEINKENIEDILGYKVQYFKVEHIFKEGKHVETKILVQPINTVEYIVIDLKISPTGDAFKD